MAGNALFWGTIGGGLAVAVGSTFAARHFAEPIRADISRKRHEDWQAMRAQQKPGTEWSPFPDNYQPGSDADFMGAALLPIFGGGAATIGGVLLQTGQPAVGIALVAAGAALVGGTIGTVIAGVHAGRAEDAGYGVRIDDQVTELMRDYDANADGRLDLRDDDRRVPESMRPGSDQVDAQYLGATSHDYVGIERFAAAADRNHDRSVTPDELRTELRTFDANRDGTINARERWHMVEAGLEDRALVQVIQ